jgi:hypothetical protein
MEEVCDYAQQTETASEDEQFIFLPELVKDLLLEILPFTSVCPWKFEGLYLPAAMRASPGPAPPQAFGRRACMKQ